MSDCSHPAWFNMNAGLWRCAHCGYETVFDPATAVETCESLQSRAEAAEADAERYRWLKENHLQLGPDCWIRTGDDLDDAIDAELQKADQSPIVSGETAGGEGQMPICGNCGVVLDSTEKHHRHVMGECSET